MNGRAEAARRWAPPAALLVFATANLALVAATGVRLGGDTVIYVDGAGRLLAGAPLVDRQPSYLGYILVVALCEWAGIGLRGLVLLQVATATLAAGAVYRMATGLAGRTAGVLAVVLLALDVHTNRWHVYVLSNSLYISALALAVWLVHRAAQRPPQARRYLGAGLLLIASALIRPEGWFVIPAAALYWVRRSAMTPASRRRLAVLVLLACVTAALAVAPRLRGNLEAVGPGTMLRAGQTIWAYDGWRVPMPAAPPYEGRWGDAGRAVSYAGSHPIATLTLMSARLAVHAIHVRPFYSVRHNALIVSWLVPVYALAALGVWRLRAHPLTRWCLVVTGTQALVVAVTHADFDGRYLAHVLPLWYPLAAGGLVWLLQQRRPAR